MGWFNIRNDQTFQLLLCNDQDTTDALLTTHLNDALIPLFNGGFTLKLI